jgi:Ca-activated chloride channel family protein
LVAIAQAAGGNVVRSEKGTTGIDVIGKKLEQMMTSELAERVETVYADVYFYPLGVALLLLVVDTFVGDSKKRKLVPPTRLDKAIPSAALERLRRGGRHAS